MTIQAAVTAIRRYVLPGDAVFPESVGIDPATGDAYVGSLADGTLYRLAADGSVAVFSPPGAGGRGSVAGVKVDAERRLWAAGGYNGSLHILDLADGEPLQQFDVGERPSCVNDIAFGPDGAAYVTDSFIPRVFRATLDELAPWSDLAAQDVPWPPELNFNGIVVAPDEQHLVVCQTNTGRLWQLELGSGRVREVALDGGPLEHCDGLALHGSTLIVAVNARNLLALVDLEADGSRGTVRTTLRSDDFAFPTAVGVHEGRVLVVNGQLDRMGRAPELPFTVVELELPAA